MGNQELWGLISTDLGESDTFEFRKRECLLQMLSKFSYLIPLDRREVREELVDRISAFQIIEQILNRNAGPAEYRFSALNIIGNCDHAIHTLIFTEIVDKLNNFSAS